MLTHEFLTEAATDVLYHYMDTPAAVRTLLDNHYSLESSTGIPAEEQLMPPGKHWYLSTTRSKVGDYHMQRASESGVIFVLDGRWLNSHYETRPVDYWFSGPKNLKPGEWKTLDPERKRSLWQYSPNRASESEDRVYSPTNAIPLRGSTTAIHVFLLPQDQLPDYVDAQRHGYRAAEVRRILNLAQQRGIPAYLYDDRKKWLSQRTDLAVDPASEYGQQLLQGQEYQRPPRPERNDPYYNSPVVWLELMRKDPGQELSKQADKLRYNLGIYSDTVSSLANDMHNAARDPGNPDYKYLIQINDFLRHNRLSGLAQLQDYLKRKWKPGV